jgi:putative intracellular protease/amidase
MASPRLRRVGRLAGVLVLTAGTFAAICLFGVSASMAQSFPRGSATHDPREWPAPPAAPAGRLKVAVAVGTTGSVVADALLPYEVFARSDRFFVYTVSAWREPVPLSGGLRVVPDYTFDTAPAPDVVVIPAVVDPAGADETPLRAWVNRSAQRGAQVLGVCAGSHVLAAAGLLDGRRATEFWANIDARRREYPRVNWRRGERYVEDGSITTTAGVTSGAVGALRLVQRLAGTAEATRIGQALAYPGWAPDAPTAIPAHRLTLSDAPYALNPAFPWLRPTIGVGLVAGVAESDVAAVFEVYSGTSFTARTVPVAASHTVTTRHGMLLLATPADGDAPDVDRLVVPGVDTARVEPALRDWATARHLDVGLPHAGRPAGEFPFDPVLRDLAAQTDRATARTAARFTEYPTAHLRLTGSAWPWRPTALAVAALLASVTVALALSTLARRALAAQRARVRSQKSRQLT